MEDERIEHTNPPRTRYKVYKYLTAAVFFIVIFFSLGLIGVETTSSSEFCSSCHEMKPQYYTWKASSHSEVDCVSCHIEPGTENYAKAKANGIAQLYKTKTDNYIAPIKMPTLIPDEACERCHNITSREVTPSGDIIIPHDKHQEEGIECVQCHSGTAHGEISDRKVTYKSDYEKWNEKLGASLMSDKKYISPKMETCMDCHKVRKAPMECTACHESSMIPDNHQSETFKVGDHGKIQSADLKTCDKCHSYMSEPNDLFKEDANYTKYLNQDESNSNSVTVSEYAKTNTFCKDCHGQKPKSHERVSFTTEHGRYSKETDTCFTCHDNRITSESPVTNVSCASCHPSSHKGGQWKERHPFKLAENQKIDRSCLLCHVEETCSKCHSNVSSTQKEQE
jgi:nitrate/TMAO reductase-like tetraheme cytochrome c subunit